MRKIKLSLIIVVLITCLAGCNSNLELLETEIIKCDVTRVYRENDRSVRGFYIDVFDTYFNQTVTLDVNSKDYGQILVGNILSIERKKFYDKDNNVYRYKYALTYVETPEAEDIESETVEDIYVTVSDKYTTVNKIGKQHRKTYHIVYEDTEANKSNTEKIDSDIYYTINIGERYKALKTKVTDKDGNTYYKYELLRKSNLN